MLSAPLHSLISQPQASGFEASSQRACNHNGMRLRGIQSSSSSAMTVAATRGASLVWGVARSSSLTQRPFREMLMDSKGLPFLVSRCQMAQRSLMTSLFQLSTGSKAKAREKNSFRSATLSSRNRSRGGPCLICGLIPVAGKASKAGVAEVGHGIRKER